MAITFSDNSATISSTEYSLVNNSTSLATSTAKCCMQALIDTTNLAAGDQYQVHVNERINGGGGGSQRTVYEAILTGAQNPPNWASPALVVGDGWDVTVKKLAGTDRVFNWSLRQVA